MNKSIKIIDCNEIKVPFDLKIVKEEIHHTIIQGPVGSGMSKITALCDSYIKKVVHICVVICFIYQKIQYTDLIQKMTES